jgi:hypothetical protein
MPCVTLDLEHVCSTTTDIPTSVVFTDYFDTIINNTRK